MKTALCLLSLVLAVLLPGCSNRHVGVQGRVVYADNEEPLECGTVAFTAANFHARGEIKEDGRFTIGSLTDRDGLPPGEYRVYFSGTDLIEGMEENPVVIPRIAKKYTQADTTDLTVTVEKSTKDLTLQVERAPKSGKR